MKRITINFQQRIAISDHIKKLSREGKSMTTKELTEECSRFIGRQMSPIAMRKLAQVVGFNLKWERKTHKNASAQIKHSKSTKTHTCPQCGYQEKVVMAVGFQSITAKDQEVKAIKSM